MLSTVRQLKFLKAPNVLMLNKLYDCCHFTTFKPVHTFSLKLGRVGKFLLAKLYPENVIFDIYRFSRQFPVAKARDKNRDHILKRQVILYIKLVKPKVAFLEIHARRVLKIEPNGRKSLCGGLKVL